MHSAQNFGANNFVMTTFLGSGSNLFFHEKGRCESCGALHRFILHRIWCAQSCDNDTLESGLGDRPSGPKLGLRNEISYRKGLKFASKIRNVRVWQQTKFS